METKTELLTRLIREGHITFEQGLVLSEKEKEIVYLPQPYQVYPQYPTVPQYPYWYTTAIDSTGTYTIQANAGHTLTNPHIMSVWDATYVSGPCTLTTSN